MEMITAEELHEILKKYLILHIIMSGFKGFKYQIVGFTMGNRDVKLIDVLEQVNKQHSNVWNKYSSDYNRSAKTKTKNQICGSLPLLQF